MVARLLGALVMDDQQLARVHDSGEEGCLTSRWIYGQRLVPSSALELQFGRVFSSAQVAVMTAVSYADRQVLVILVAEFNDTVLLLSVFSSTRQRHCEMEFRGSLATE